MTIILVTGTAPHSLGEALVDRCLRTAPEVKVICVDIEPNNWLRKSDLCYPITLDLNPLLPSRNYKDFLYQLQYELETALTALRGDAINIVTQCAGLYWSGPFISLNDDMRRKLLGVNLLGHIEVLHTAMRINDAHGVANSENLAHVDVGSFQGLHARSGRSVYATSKAAGLDFAAALHAGRETARSVYFAAGPVDTHMLHYNHWVVKARGPADVLARQKYGDRKRYRSIFIECSEPSFYEWSTEQGLDNSNLEAVFRAYEECRIEAKREEFGVLSAEECAEFLLDIALSPTKHPSGVYLSMCRASKPDMRYARFEELDRLAVARRLWDV